MKGVGWWEIVAVAFTAIAVVFSSIVRIFLIVIYFMPLAQCPVAAVQRCSTGPPSNCKAVELELGSPVWGKDLREEGEVVGVDAKVDSGEVLNHPIEDKVKKI